MSKVTSKLQVTLPKSIADRFNIKPGDQIDWEAAGDTIRVVPPRKDARREQTPVERLKYFDRATERQKKREKPLDSDLLAAAKRQGRGWARTDLYEL